MKTDVWMPFYVGDYLKDTMHLSARDHGAYLLLILAYWNNDGPLPDDDDYLAGVTKSTTSEWPSIRRRLERFFEITPFSLATASPQGRSSDAAADATASQQRSQDSRQVWRHKRIDRELDKARNRRKCAIEKGKKGNDALATLRRRSSDAPAIPAATPKRSPKERSSPSPSQDQHEREQAAPEVSRPSLAEVKAYAYTIGLAAWKAEDWFNEMEGCGWLDYQGREITKWEAVIARVKAKWEADGRPTAPPSNQTRPATNVAPGTANSATEVIRLQSELKRVEERLKRIIDISPSTMADGVILSDEHKAERAKLIERKRELLKALGFKA